MVKESKTPGFFLKAADQAYSLGIPGYDGLENAMKSVYGSDRKGARL
jgi:hypothetical protein